MLFARNLRATPKTGRLLSLAKRYQSAPAVEIKRGKDREPISAKPGDVIHGFKLNNVTAVKERNVVCYELEHEKTGAKHLHIDSDDTNNVFCATFKTTPQDSTGVAHILEHTTLCGSNKYPVRDPFFNMSRRSLSTYMNAWTGADHTSYPFATQNPKDYYNLMSVYLDAVFYPKLDEIDFRQEGHRLEFENNDDTNSKLMFKGVVFNEMKGVFADPSNIFMESTMRKLFPTSTYSHSSGGEPAHITDLTYEQLKNFHKTHYHPSNSWFFTYGDLPLEERLKFINENGLAKFDKFDSKTEVTKEERWTQPRNAEISAPPAPLSADPERQTKVAVSFLLTDVTDPYESFLFALLSSLLTRGPSSPFYSSLIDSGLGYEYSPGTGYDSSTKEGTFTIGVQGVKAEDVDKVLETIKTTIDDAATNGFPQERIDSILHQIEFLQKNITANFGMQLMGVMSAWIHGGNPIDHISINKHIEQLKADLASKPLFQNLIKQYLSTSNNHKITVVMTPDEQHLKKEADAEAQKLVDIQAKLTQAEKDTIAKEAKILKERQEFKQDVSVLPSLRVSGIQQSEVKVVIADETLESGVPMQWVDSVTNGITYFRACLDLSGLSEDLRVYLPLFASVLTEMGTASYDNKQLAQAIDMYTGGIEFAPSSVISPYDVQMTREGLHVSSASLRGNVENMFHLLTSIFCEPKFSDHELLQTLLGQRMSNLQDSINHSGSAYAKMFASSSFDRSHYLKELWNGMTQISFVQNLMKAEETNEWAALAEKLQEIARVVLRKDNLRISIVGEERYKQEIMRPLSAFIEKLPSTPPSLFQKLSKVPILGSFVGSKPEEVSEWKASVPFSPLSNSQKSFFVLPSSVNYVAKCLSTIPYDHEDSAHLQILLRILNSCYLHTEIREKGGAYGSGASLQSGIVAFSSYRDPNVTNTVNVIDNSLSWVHKNIFTDQDIVEAKISIFSDIDSPVPPSGKGLAEFYRGITYEMRQKRREQLLSTERKDIVRVAEKYLPIVASKGVVTVLGGEEMANEMKKLGWEVKSE